MNQSSNPTEIIGLVFPDAAPACQAKAGKTLAGTAAIHTPTLKATFPTWKRAVDVCLVILAAPALVPAMAGIALLIKLLSRGPVIFCQERVGFSCSRFNCFKFRTMQMDANTKPHEKLLKDLIKSDKPMTKMDRTGDPRLIPLGAFLRATGLDELPQLLNVLRGEMSLVGPRPCIVYEFLNYPMAYQARFNTPPGLTGLWQVSGKNHTSFSEMMRLDLQYIRHRSLRLDLSIMFRTFAALYWQARELREKDHAMVSRPHLIKPLVHCTCCQKKPDSHPSVDAAVTH